MVGLLGMAMQPEKGGWGRGSSDRSAMPWHRHTSNWYNRCALVSPALPDSGDTIYTERCCVKEKRCTEANSYI